MNEEQEYRLVRPMPKSEKDRCFVLPEECFRSITLGYNIDPIKKQDIAKLICATFNKVKIKNAIYSSQFDEVFSTEEEYFT
ncbi:MAG: hypothetical protein ABIX01_19600 [Chitinophagaceae bacterium]